MTLLNSAYCIINNPSRNLRQFDNRHQASVLLLRPPRAPPHLNFPCVSLKQPPTCTTEPRRTFHLQESRYALNNTIYPLLHIAPSLVKTCHFPAYRNTPDRFEAPSYGGRLHPSFHVTSVVRLCSVAALCCHSRRRCFNICWMHSRSGFSSLLGTLPIVPLS